MGYKHMNSIRTRYFLFAFLIVCVNTSHGLELSLFSGKWSFDNGSTKIIFELNDRSNKGDIVTFNFNGKLVPLELDFVYARDGIYPLLSFYKERSSPQLEFESYHVYLIPGTADDEYFLSGFFEYSVFDDPARETLKTNSSSVVFRKEN